MDLAWSPTSHAAIFDAVADFETNTTNPNSVWSYGYDPASISGYQFRPFDQRISDGYLVFWQDSNYVSYNTPSIYKNLGSSTIYGVLPGQVALHPGPASNGDAAILRFTAPQSTTYDVLGQFFVGDPYGDTDAQIVRNGSLFQSLGSTTNNPNFGISNLFLATGDTLDFVIGNSGSYAGDSTPVVLQISTAVPEPLTLLGAGTAVLFGVMFKRHTNKN
jgi:hypothetical protein